MKLAVEAARFRETLSVVRSGISPAFEWYPYDSLANAERIDTLLGDLQAEVLGEAGKSPILDIGCGDGDLSFLLESLGYPVTAIDHPSTNHNGMRGIRKLREALASNVKILEVDIDSQFSLPDRRFRLVLFLGLLYHLKNPFHALERLAKSCDYCLLSTRIARKLPDGRPMSPEHPLAYLLAADELNQDNSNFWIFNDAGLRRLFARTHWEVVEFFTAGDTVNSDPASLEHDERAFCLLRSRYGLANVELLHGWHQPEDAGWRWVAKQFAIQCDRPRTRMSVRGFLPPEVVDQLGEVQVAIAVNGTELRPETLSDSGDFHIVRNLPEQGTAGAVIGFSVDKAMPVNEMDGRELALIISAIELE